ncbi:MAG: tRNA epoxyqueuosine(34) reductase QueG [Dehalococcoidia bacterium]|nr:tRNA epoxyqueuosine(34) reductase QueG [Dehalococcoidia bacterium]
MARGEVPLVHTPAAQAVAGSVIADAATPGARAVAVKRLARDAGFDLAAITGAGDLSDAESVIASRIRAGLMDGLPWYTEARARRGCRPTEILPGARSIIALGVSYYTPAPDVPADGALRGRVSRYAWGQDYHRVIEQRLRRLMRGIQSLGGRAAKAYVDYGPPPDRAVARRAGLGWYGKHTNLLTSSHGSWVFLAEVLTDLDLAPDAPLKKSCGSCAACIPACPTGAIVAPYVLDNRRCISYHTIENRGVIPLEFRAGIGDWVFGCDLCQDACPVNHRKQAPGDAAFAAASLEHARPDLAALLVMTNDEFRERYKHSAIRRATLAGLQRNACIALGNLGDRRAVPDLARALRHAAPLVRGHAAWALGRLGGVAARDALAAASGDAHETDAWVRQEISLALEMAAGAA